MKIDIIGSVASGKTTLAKRISNKYGIPYYDYIIVLNEYTIVRLIRVLRRWINQRNGREPYNSKPTWSFLWLNFKWVWEFNQMKKQLLQELSMYGEKVKIFKHSTNAYAFCYEKCYLRSETWQLILRRNIRNFICLK